MTTERGSHEKPRSVNRLMCMPNCRRGAHDHRCGKLFPVELRPEFQQPLLAARVIWEAENPRPEALRRAERAIVRGLKNEGLGPQYQVTREDGFEIAVAGVLIRVELDANA